MKKTDFFHLAKQTCLNTLAEAMQETFEPFVAQVDRIEFSRVYEKEYEIINFIVLQ